MVWKCGVPLCKSTRNNAKMHRCPRRNAVILKKWLQILKREDLHDDPIASELFVCDRHFSGSQNFTTSNKNRTNLMHDAVPDKELPDMNLLNNFSLETSNTSNKASEDIFDVSSQLVSHDSDELPTMDMQAANTPNEKKIKLEIIDIYLS